MIRPLLIGLLLGGLGPMGCGDNPEAPLPAQIATAAAPPSSPKSASPPSTVTDPEERLVKASHLELISGDLKGARRVLGQLTADGSVPRGVRARGLLRLADLAERAGQRRAAVGRLEQAKAMAGPGHALAFQADDRRTRILTEAPLADVRGPVPGSTPLQEERRPVVAAFRKAEKRLGAYHRVVVAPRIEEVSRVLDRKRGLFKKTVAAYQAALEGAGPSARAAVYFRLGALNHNLAEVLAFEMPPELLPEAARKLRRELRAESAALLGKALEQYRQSHRIKPAPGTQPWQQLAGKEAATLSRILNKP